MLKIVVIAVYDEQLAIKELLEAKEELGKISSYSEFDALRKTYLTKYIRSILVEYGSA